MVTDTSGNRALTRGLMSSKAILLVLAFVLLFLLASSGSAASDEPKTDKAMQHMLAVISAVFAATDVAAATRAFTPCFHCIEETPP